MPRKAINTNGKPMTPAERKRRSRALLAGSLAGELAAAHINIEHVRKTLARTLGGTAEDVALIDALDAIKRAEHLLTQV